VSTDKLVSQEAVVNALASRADLTSAEIATITGLARSTVAKSLAALERSGMVSRGPGGRDGRRRLPDRWSLGSADKGDTPTRASTSRLRPGQLDELVRGYIDSLGNDAAGATAVAKALGRSAGAVANCLTRLAGAGRVRQVSDKPRRYSSAISSSRTAGRAARRRKANS
jgi:DNA-binding IclR family transcriptional regulator